MSSSKNHFLMVDGVKMRSKKSAGTPKRKNDKAIASDSNKGCSIHPPEFGTRPLFKYRPPSLPNACIRFMIFFRAPPLGNRNIQRDEMGLEANLLSVCRVVDSAFESRAIQLSGGSISLTSVSRSWILHFRRSYSFEGSRISRGGLLRCDSHLSCS
jgi:hypothetical protein